MKRCTFLCLGADCDVVCSSLIVVPGNVPGMVAMFS